MNFKIENGHMENHCHKQEGTCCMHCKYVYDDKDGRWIACSDSCISHKDITGKISCVKCKHTTYGQKI